MKHIIFVLFIFLACGSPQLKIEQVPQIKYAFAKVQRDGKPHRAFYNHYVWPHAIVENGQVFCTFEDGESRPVVMAYDLNERIWRGPVITSEFGLGSDTHGNPALCIDKDGILHLFFGCHVSRIYHVRSKKPFDISTWEEAPSPASKATYTQSFRMADDRLFLLYRAGGHVEPWVLQISNDNGQIWSEPEKIIEMRLDPKDPYSCAYCSFLPGSDKRTIHCFFLHKDDNPPKLNGQPHPWRPLKYSGLHEAVYRYNVYYIFRDESGIWRNGRGEALQLPITKAQADSAALVYDSGHQFAFHRRMLIDNQNQPYLRFDVGVEDWVNSNIIIPYQIKYLTLKNRMWEIEDHLPDYWPDEIKKQIITRGSPGYGELYPNNWTIEQKTGPEEDSTAAYIWLSHPDFGYITRNGRPVLVDAGPLR